MRWHGSGCAGSKPPERLWAAPRSPSNTVQGAWWLQHDADRRGSSCKLLRAILPKHLRLRDHIFTPYGGRFAVVFQVHCLQIAAKRATMTAQSLNCLKAVPKGFKSASEQCRVHCSLSIEWSGRSHAFACPSPGGRHEDIAL